VSFTGCVHVAEKIGLIPEKPEIELVDLKIQSASFAKINITVVLNVSNRDSRTVRINNLDFDLFFSGNQLGAGSIQEKVSIAANSTEQVAVPVALDTKGLIGAAVELIGGSAAGKARIRGNARIETWFGLISVPFDRELRS
jgi:LEA14-like dessication related protein